jgi:hypothetical protein
MEKEKPLKTAWKIAPKGNTAGLSPLLEEIS